MSTPTDHIGIPVAEKIVMGLSTIFGVTCYPGQGALTIKFVGLSGGVLEIGGTYCLVAGATTAFTWGKGYSMEDREVLSFSNLRGNVLLAASGATATVMVLRGIAQGV